MAKRAPKDASFSHASVNMERQHVHAAREILGKQLVAQSGIQLSSAKTHRKLGMKFFLALQNAKRELKHHEHPTLRLRPHRHSDRTVDLQSLPQGFGARAHQKSRRDRRDACRLHQEQNQGDPLRHVHLRAMHRLEHTATHISASAMLLCLPKPACCTQRK